MLLWFPIQTILSNTKKAWPKKCRLSRIINHVWALMPTPNHCKSPKELKRISALKRISSKQDSFRFSPSEKFYWSSNTIKTTLTLIHSQSVNSSKGRKTRSMLNIFFLSLPDEDECTLYFYQHKQIDLS